MTDVVSIPDAVDAQARDAARDALDAAPTDGDTLALVSGGHDSLTAMHIAYAARRIDLDGVVHINTGIGVPETREFVKQRAAQLGLDYYEVGKPEKYIDEHEYRYPSEEYYNLVKKYGFPGPAAHKWMYVNLKEKPLQRWLSDHYPDKELTFISGVSRHESDNRMENVAEDGHQEFLGVPTVSPLVEFTSLDVRRYRRGKDLQMNPVVEKLEMSGECLCGAYSSRGEMRMIRLFYPDVYRRLLCLESTVSIQSNLDDGPDEEYTKWGHNRLQDREQEAMNDDDQMLLCTACEQANQCDGSDDCDS